MEQPLRIALVAFIDDPLDPPGYERFGGGQSFCYDLIRYLARRGDEVDVVTRLNDRSKSRCEQIGFNVRIHRIAAGAPRELDPVKLIPLLPELLEGTTRVLAATLPTLDAIHTQYWLSGNVGRSLAESHGIRHIHHPLSFQREKRRCGDPDTRESHTREQSELQIFASVDCLVLLTSAELETFRSLYPECADTSVAVIPHGADHGVFFPRPESPRAYVRRAAARLEQGTRNVSGRD
jgi:D-inositol-3-phosphate glycosyltransferase